MPSKKRSQVDVILDARMIRHTGIGTYLRGLLSEYQNHPFLSKHSFGLALPKALFSEMDGVAQIFPFNFPVYSVWEQAEYPFQLARCKLWHAPHYNVPLFKKNTRLVVTVHDLIHWIFRKEFYSPTQALYAQFLFQKAVQLADRIITVSNQTQEDLIKHFKAPRDKIRVIYEGVSTDFFKESSSAERQELLQRYKLPERFFLFVGLIKPHKNVHRLVHIFRNLRKAGKIDSELVIVGKKDRKYPQGFESLKNLTSGNGIHYLPSVNSRKDLALLYASARCLIHPSRYEGFGLTCLEAMAAGTPVIASRVASLPEVVGEAGYYVDPESEDSIGGAILELEEKDSLRRDLSEKGRLRARQFNWTKAARDTIQIYQEVLDS